MASRDGWFRALLSTFLLLFAAGAAHAQNTGATTTSSKPQAGTETAADNTEQAPEPEWRWRFLSVGGDVGLTSAYVWRGFVLHDGTCLQPDIWVKLSDFTVTSWLNVRNNGLGDRRLNEYDLLVDYSRDVSRVTLSAGWTNYRFFGHESGQTNEFYAGLRADVPLQPGVQVYRDVQQGDGTYVSLSASQEWPLTPQVSGTASVALGYNNHLYMEGSGFSDVAFTVKLSIPVASARAALQPSLTYSRSLMPDMFPSRLFGGLAVAFK